MKKNNVLEVDSFIGDVEFELQKQQTILQMICELSFPEDYPTETPEQKMISAMQALNIMEKIQNLTLVAMDQNDKMTSVLSEADKVTDIMVKSARV